MNKNIKKKLIISIFIVVLIFIASFFFVTKKDNQLILKNKGSNIISMMLETGVGSGNYQESKDNKWPLEGYSFNSALSKCEKGGTLNWDNDNNQVIFEGNNEDKCYVYFDANPIYLNNYVKSLYTGTQGENNLYYHDSTLENGANDNSYRYAGSSDTTNNFVCFGYDSSDGSCPTDNLYRIIGVFGDNVKLIKYDYANSNLLGTDGDYCSWVFSKNSKAKYVGDLTSINTYHWNYSDGSSSKNNWSESRLNTVNLNTNYLNNIGNSWSNKIATHTWKVGGNIDSSIAESIPATAYQNEIVSPAENTTYDAKVGLMYVGDYAFSAIPNFWSTSLNVYKSTSVNNWIYMGIVESVLTRRSDTTNDVFEISEDGSLGRGVVNKDVGNAIRPVFYLNSDVMYVSGAGTKASPMIITD